MDSDRRRSPLNALLDKTRAPLWVRASICSDTSLTSMHTRRRAQSALYTSALSQWLLPPAATQIRDVDRAVRVAKHVGWARAKYDRLCAFVEATVEQLHRADTVNAAVICTQTLEQEGRAVFHFHSLLRHVDLPVWLPGSKVTVFEDTRPNVTAAPNLGGRRGTGPRSWAGYLHCTVPKLGQVFVPSNKAPFWDVPVQGQRVMASLQTCKIEAAMAQELVYKVAQAVTRWLADLDLIERRCEESRVVAAR